MERKFFKLKLDTLEDTGNFSGYGAVFNNVDLGKDIIDVGAFNRTIKNHGGIIPILFNHWSDKEIGLSSSLKENDTGLLLSAKLYISDDPKMDLPDARQTYIKMKYRQMAGKSMGMSIGYDTLQSYQDEKNREIRHLKEIKLWEISAVTFPMNEKATIENVKSMFDEELKTLLEYFIDNPEELKEGRVLSTENHTLVQQAIEVLQALLTAAEPKTDSDSDFLKAAKGLAGDLNSEVSVLEFKRKINEIRRM